MNPIFDLNKSIKENGVLKTFLFLLGFVLVSAVVSGSLGYEKGLNTNISNNANISVGINSQQTSSGLIGDRSVKCTESSFEDSIENWDTSSYGNPDDQGFYCPKSWSAFSSPDIWYNELVPFNFEVLTMRYRIINKNNSTSTPPTFIFSLGNDPRILRFFAHEKNPQVVGFEKISIEDPCGELKREAPARILKEPVRYDSPVDISLRSMIKKENEIQFTFNLNYISAETGTPVEDSFSYDVKVLDPQPGEGLSKIRIGFGTLKGSCIKPISFKFCY